MAEDTILYEVADGVATITLNRPHARNAFDVPTLELLYKTSVRAAQDRGVRAIVVTGAGGHFSAGGDVKAMGAALGGAGPSGAALLFKELTIYFHATISTLARAAKPFLTAIDGTAAGGGFSLAIAGDVSIASDRAQLSYSYTNIALAPDGSSSWTLPRLVGPKRAMWLALRNPRLTAEEARALGLVNEVVPAVDFERRWRGLARELAEGPTLAFAAAKRLFRGSLGNALEAQMEDEREAIAACAETADFVEGCTAFIEKRKARFAGA